MHNYYKIGGILSIISGAFGIVWTGFFVFFSLYMFQFMSGPGYGAPPREFFTFMKVFYSAMGAFFAVVGILAIIGGVFALKRRGWGLALAGAIAGTVTFFPTGIPAIIYVAMAKPEFSAQQMPGSTELKQ